MFRKLRDLFNRYREYVRVDLLMYVVLIGMILAYFIVTQLILS